MSDGPFVVTLEGVDELERRWASSVRELERDSNAVALNAAHEGASRMRQDHPYTDRTGTLTKSMTAYELPESAVGDDVEYAAQIDVSAEYASFVDRGRAPSKSLRRDKGGRFRAPAQGARAFPFTPQGERDAEKSLNQGEREAVKRFERGVKGG